MSKVLIVFSTVGGNTGLVVEKVRQMLSNKGFEVTKKRVDVSEPTEIKDYDLTILASPTYNQGTLEDHFKNFIKEFSNQNWKSHKFAVIGLGDTKYYPEYLTEAATILEEKIQEKNGQLVTPALRIGTDPIKMIDKLVPKWVERLAEVIRSSK